MYNKRWQEPIYHKEDLITIEKIIMTFFYSEHADYLLCADAITLLMCGYICLSVARDKALIRTFSEWYLLAPAFILMSFREWLGIYSLSNPHWPAWLPISMLFQNGASLCLLAAAHRKRVSGIDVDAEPDPLNFGNIVDLLFLLAIITIPVCTALTFIVTEGDLATASAPFNQSYLIGKVLFFLLCCYLYLRCWQSHQRPSALVMRIFRVFCILGFLILICIPPGIPTAPDAFTPGQNTFFSVLFLLRTTVALILSTYIWNGYAQTRGVTSNIRWWPIVLMLAIFLSCFAFIHRAHNRDEEYVQRNLIASAVETTERIDMKRLKEVIANPALIHDQEHTERLFNRIRKNNFYVGHSDIAAVTNLLIRPDPNQPPILLADSLDAILPARSLGNGWTRDPGLQEKLWHSVDHNASAVIPDLTRRLNPTFLTVAILDPVEPHGPDGQLTDPTDSTDPAARTRHGVAVFAVSSIDLARNSFNFKSIFLYFLPLGFLGLMFLLSGQQHAWLAEHSSRRAEALRIGALGNGLAGSIIIQNGIIIDCNQRALDINGMTRNQFVGKRAEEIFNKNSTSMVASSQSISAHPEEDKIFDVTFQRPDGRVVNLIAQCRTLSDLPDNNTIIWDSVDITEQKKIENQVRQLIDTLPNPVCFLDRQRVIRLCNQAFCDEAGVTDLNDLLGKPYDEVKPLGAVDVDFEEKALSTGVSRSEISFEFLKNGVLRNFVLIRNVVRSPEGEIIGLLKVFWDTTDLVSATRAARQAERAKAAFLTGMSHELRTPMNGIVGMADLIIDNDSTRPLPRLYAETIVRSAKTLQMAIDEVMDVATIEDASQRLDLKKEAFPLLPLVEDSADVVSSIAEAWGIELSLGYDFSLDEKYIGDARRLRQILVQILTYCSRISLDRRLRLEVAGLREPENPPGEAEKNPVLPAEIDPVLFSANRSMATAGKVRHQVEFQAIFVPSSSITPHELEERFRNPSAPTNEAANFVFGNISHRIGLPLIWKLVDLMGGRLDAYMRDGQIHCRVVLPLERVDHPAWVSTPNLSSQRVLAATDSPYRAGTIRASLSYARANVTLAMSIDEVRRLLTSPDRADEPFHLLILDQRLTPMEELEEFLRELDEKQDLLPARPPRHIILIVSSRQAQNLPESGGRIKYLILPPLLPRELWDKTFALSRPATLALRPRSLSVGRAGMDEDTVVLSSEAFTGGGVSVSSGAPGSARRSDSTRTVKGPRPAAPASVAADLAHAPNHTAKSPSSRNGTSVASRPPPIPARVLLAEDNTVNQMVAMGILKRIGATTVLAKNGQEAVDSILRGETFDLILMDCMMPVVDGYHATAMIRLYENGTPGAKRNIIVALTANNVAGDREKCLKSGMDDYIPKPVSMQQLREILVKYCGELVGSEGRE